MVDAVIIEGLGSGISQWATESTTNEILKTLQKMHKLSDAQLKQMQKCCDKNRGDKKGLSDIDKALNDFEDDTKKNSKAVKESTKQTDEFTKTLGKAIGGIIGFAGMLTGVLTNQLSMMQELNSSGMNLLSDTESISSGLGTFADAAMTANLSFKELAKLQKEYGNTLNIYGVQRFARTAKSFNKNIDNLGMTAIEGSEYLAGYLEIQRSLGLAQVGRETQQAAAAQSLLESMDSLSKVTGLSKKQMLDNIAAGIKQNTQTGLWMATASEGVRDSYMKFAAMFGPDSEQLKQNITDLITDPFSTRTEMWRTLASVVPGATDQLENLKHIINNGGTVTDADFAKFSNTFNDANIEMLRTMGVNGNAGAKLAAETILQIKQMKENQAAKAKLDSMSASQQKQQLVDQIRASANMNDAWKNITTFLERTMGKLMQDPKVAQQIADFAEKLANSLVTIVPKLVDFSSKLLNMIVPALDILGAALDLINLAFAGFDPKSWADGIKSFFEHDLATIFAVGIGALFAGNALKNILMKGLGSIFGGAGPGGGAGGGPGGGAGGMLGNLLGGLGKGAGALLAGLGQGLAAVGALAPEVIAGAGAIAAAIALIGAGIAGAAWLTGAALPTLSEGLQSFADLDSQRLSDAGYALVDLSKGMTAFAGAGIINAVSSLSSVLANVTGHGVDDIVTTLNRFASIKSIELIKLSEALMIFTPAMQYFADTLAGDIGSGNDALSDFADTITELLEKLGEVDTTKLTIFGQLALDIKELTSSIIELEGVSAVSIGANNGVTIGEKPIVQVTEPTLTSPGSSGTNLGKTPPNPKQAEKVSEINTLQELDIMKKQLKVLVNIAENQSLQVQYFKKLALGDDKIDKFK